MVRNGWKSFFINLKIPLGTEKFLQDMQDIALKILVIEDNDALREATLAFLQNQGHFVRGVPQAEDLNDVTGGFLPDVYVIDLTLPDEDGLSLTKRLRATQPHVGIVITTARTQIGDKVVGYESGADLYLTKPVHPQELMAGVAAVGKRLRSLKHQQDSSLVLNLSRLQLMGPNGKVDLTSSDAILLGAFAKAPGQSLERWQVSEVISPGTEELPAAATLEMRIARLRKKLLSVGATNPCIKAQHKVGYSLCISVVIE